jgi:hypothetical protein
LPVAVRLPPVGQRTATDGQEDAARRWAFRVLASLGDLDQGARRKVLATAIRLNEG